ncbi:MAG TPA: hypothetical protein VKA35_05020 [Solirubrobacterales bacterium]|nr:hypothetical protein [Solirubrobacterales bacterium]
MEESGQLRDAYVPNRRVRLASDVAGIAAVLLLIGLLGAAFTLWGRSDLFDLAGNSRESIKIDTGFLIGPILILVALPLVIGRSRQLALKRYFKERLAVASLLWIAGLVTLIGQCVWTGRVHARGRNLRLSRSDDPRPSRHAGDVAGRPTGGPGRPARIAARTYCCRIERTLPEGSSNQAI